jgi:hypothetical protein
VLCRNSTSRITYLGAVEDFAVSVEQSRLAVVTKRVLSRSASTQTVAYTANVIDLAGGRTATVDGPNRLLSTCGSILTNGIRERETKRDIATGQDVSFPPYIHFRCSADGREVFGLTDAGVSVQQSALYRGIPPLDRIAGAPEVNASFFNVSPDGSKVAFFGDSHPLCLWSRPVGVQCAKLATLTDPVSVNDFGEVLVSIGTGRGCVYRTAWDFSPADSPTGGDDECLAVGYWKPGMPSVAIVAPLGRTPQWISPKTADLLQRWSSREYERQKRR